MKQDFMEWRDGMPDNLDELVEFKDKDPIIRAYVHDPVLDKEFKVRIEENESPVIIVCSCEQEKNKICRHAAMAFFAKHGLNYGIEEAGEMSPRPTVEKKGEKMQQHLEGAKTSAEAVAILQKEFPRSEWSWRIGSSGMGQNGPWAKLLAYLQSRDVHNRLDEAFGPFNWRFTYREMSISGGKAGVIATLWFKDPGSGAWLHKEGGGTQTEFEGFKGGLSDAEKRAFEQLGGGRHLYYLPEIWAVCSINKDDLSNPHYAVILDKDKNKRVPYYWDVPGEYK